MKKPGKASHLASVTCCGRNRRTTPARTWSMVL